MTSNEIREQINQRADVEQKMRKDFMDGKRKELDTDMDQENTEFLKKVIEEIGWPTIGKVGKTASYNAWLIVQHSPELTFQKKCLSLIKPCFGDIDKRNYAYLKDRILITDGKEQIFGTQFKLEKKTGKMLPYTVEDPANLTKRRKRFNLD